MKTLTDTTIGHLHQDELVSCALNSGSQAAQAHLEHCEACRNEMESFRSILSGIRTVFSTPPPRVHVFKCNHGLMKEEHACTVEHPVTGDLLMINCHNGWLKGHLTRTDDAVTDKTATSVRLFSRQGLVGSVPVDETGSFVVQCLNVGERHSMTIVLPGDGSAIQLLSSEPS